MDVDTRKHPPLRMSSLGDEMILENLDSFDETMFMDSDSESPIKSSVPDPLNVIPSPSSQAVQSPPQQQQQPPKQQVSPSSPLEYYYGYDEPSFGNLPTQDNAKLPNSQISVDRSNSGTTTSRYSPTTQRDIEEMIRLNETDVSLTEFFLKSQDRQGLNRNYQTAGVLRERSGSNITPGNSGRSSLAGSNSIASASNFNSEDDLANVLPKPVGNSTKVTTMVAPAPAFDLEKITSSILPTPVGRMQGSAPLPTATDPAQISYYPFGRTYPLPIPTVAAAPAPQPSLPTTAVASSPQAVETAAAIVAQASVQQLPKPQPSSPSKAKPPQTTKNGSSPNQRPMVVPKPVMSAPSPPPPPPPPGATHTYYHPRIPTTTTSAPAPPHPPIVPNTTSQPPVMTHLHPRLGVPGPYTTAQSTTVSPKLSSQANGKALSAPVPAPVVPSILPRRGTYMPGREHSSAHATPKAALVSADQRRRGYNGFRPSPTQRIKPKNITLAPIHKTKQPTKLQPQPKLQPRQKVTTKAAAVTAVARANETVGTKRLYSPQSSSMPVAPTGTYQPPDHLHHHGAADSAYERKKQRAKDSRVKLNESIERLSVSISVAGGQSKERLEQLINVLDPNGPTHQCMDQCVKIAEGAKKWDRPNFVGTAASLIQALNDQCELLMKELLKGTSDGVTTPQVDVEKSTNDGPPPDQEENGEKKRPMEEAESLSDGEHTAKRSRVEDDENSNSNSNENNTMDENSTTDENNTSGTQTVKIEEAVEIPTTREGACLDALDITLLQKIACYLDPKSLMLYSSIYKFEKRRALVRETWPLLCMKRFGYVKLRQWQDEQEDDDDEDDEKRNGEKTVAALPSMLYCKMDAANVMPQSSVQCVGMEQLGETRLAHKFSAWTYVVERSNGETMRSVLVNPANNRTTTTDGRSVGSYTSLPVVELRTVIQNTGPSPITIKEQQLVTVDAATRRRGEEMMEINWDDRFQKQFLNLDGSTRSLVGESSKVVELSLFDSVMVVTYINARRCSTITKFKQRSKFVKLLVGVNGLTEPLIIPFSNAAKSKVVEPSKKSS